MRGLRAAVTLGLTGRCAVQAREARSGLDPAVHIRRPRVDYESHVAHLDRNEFGAILVTAGLS